jgi:peptidyl-dipeptidase A
LSLTESPHRLAESLEERWREVEIEFHRAYWDSQTEATPERERRRAELELQIRELKGDPESLRAVTAALDEELHDPAVRRQLEVLRLSLVANQMDEPKRKELVELSSSVESDFASFRPEVDGARLSDNEIEDILRTSDDVRLRESAWRASKEIGDVVSARVRELARVRNEAAIALGYADYYRMSLELEEISEEWLFERMSELERLTDEPFRRWKSALDDRLSHRFGTTELRPWHYSDRFFQMLPPDGSVTLDDLFPDTSAPKLAEETFASWGMDISKVIANSDLFPRERKSQHAFCLDVDRKGDVRILGNVVPGEHWVEVMLHESGHAAYDLGIDSQLPYLLRRPAHTFTTESIAILCGRLVRDPRWLIEIAGIEPRRVSSLEGDLLRANAAHSLIFARWGLVMTYFERELYSDPEADLDEKWWDVVERFQLLVPPEEPPPGTWAAKVHVATAPVYYHNYLLGEILASQLEATAEQTCGGLIGKPEAGSLLTDRMFRPGNLLRWDALVEQATGRPLSAADFSKRVSI